MTVQSDSKQILFLTDLGWLYAYLWHSEDNHIRYYKFSEKNGVRKLIREADAIIVEGDDGKQVKFNSESTWDQDQQRIVVSANL